MEEKEAQVPSKAATLTVIAEKSSNVAFAARRIIEIHRTTPNSNPSSGIITVMDADTHLSQDDFSEISRLHYKHITEADRSFYVCSITFDRNSTETPNFGPMCGSDVGFCGTFGHVRSTQGRPFLYQPLYILCH
ncbi:hypothetical protein VTN02DRAFT_3672 [Thermoascus thermophilus]